MSWKTLRNECGQTASEYMGILLLVAVIIGTLVQSGVAGKIAGSATDMVQAIAGGGNDNGGGGKHPGGGGGGGNNPGGGGGGGNNPGGGGGSNPGGTSPGGQSDEEKRTIACLNSTAEASNCLLAARAPNGVSEKINERARDKLMKAQKKLYNTARPGTPEFNEALTQRNAALKEFLDSKRITNNFIAKPLSQIRKFADPRPSDIQAGMDRVNKALGRTGKLKLPAPNTASGGPVVETPASKVLSHVGKLGKGLGIAGTALGLYTNVNKDGTAKGIVETAGGTAAAYGAGVGITMACGAIGVATAGVGGLACAAVAFGGSYLAGKYGTQITGWAYDRGADAVHAVNEHVVKPVADVTKKAAHTVVDGGKKVLDGGKKVVGALNPFG